MLPVAAVGDWAAPQLAAQVPQALVLPSSQVSVPSLIPLPHFWHTEGVVPLPPSQVSVPFAELSPPVGLQDEGVEPVQVKPGSTAQEEEHPSALTVLPSSHCSEPALIPSPQAVAVQTLLLLTTVQV